MVAHCQRRGKGPAAYIGDLINYMQGVAPNEFIIDLFVTSLNSGYTQRDFKVNNLILPKIKTIYNILLKIPRLRAYFKYRLLRNTYNYVFAHLKYDIVIFHSIPHDISSFVRIAHNNNCKTLLFPWGSEILRASHYQLERYKYAFEHTDYVRGDGAMMNKFLIDTYNIPNKRFVNITYGSRVISLIEEYKNSHSKEALLKKAGLRKATYYIICGYSAAGGQCHEDIIKQIALVKKDLPKGYLLVFPLTYGVGADINRIKSLCGDFDLDAEFLLNYLSDEQIACLHLLSDLFIHVQKTDLANSFLSEELYAGATVINGGWLHYPDLEKYGKPYYTAQSIDCLHESLSKCLLDNKRLSITEELKKELEKEKWENCVMSWVIFLRRLRTNE